jgi:hypothetical protein
MAGSVGLREGTASGRNTNPALWKVGASVSVATGIGASTAEEVTWADYL